MTLGQAEKISHSPAATISKTSGQVEKTRHLASGSSALTFAKVFTTAST
jgi:hypothetical protein